MKNIKIGFGRVYDAKSCSIRGSEEFSASFIFGNVKVQAYVGPHLHHIQLNLAFESPISKSRQQAITNGNAKPDLQQADKTGDNFYTELIATQILEVEDELANSFNNMEKASTDEILKLAMEKQTVLTKAIDFTAGVLGLHLHHLLVSSPIYEQIYAYRSSNKRYNVAERISINVIQPYVLDIPNAAILIRSKLQPKWSWEKASEVFAWLLRAWETSDPVLKFVCLFTALEMVIPNENVPNDFKSIRDRILVKIKEDPNDEERKQLTDFIKNLPSPQISLNKRFEIWAKKLAMPGWENDVAAFRDFAKLRNLLLHSGKPEVKFKIGLNPGDVRTLEDIAQRYTWYSTYGDAYKGQRLDK